MIANTVDLLEEYVGNDAYGPLFSRLNTAMSLPANLVGKYIIKSLKEYNYLEPVAKLITEFYAMEKSGVSDKLSAATHVMTSKGRFSMTGVNSPIVKIGENKIFFKNNRLYAINSTDKSVYEYTDYSSVPNKYIKLCAALNGAILENQSSSFTDGMHNFEVSSEDGVKTIKIDGTPCNDLDDAMSQMSTLGISPEIMQQILDTYNGVETIETVDNTALIENDAVNGEDMMVIMVGPSTISIMMVDENLRHTEIVNGMSAKETREFVMNSTGLDLKSMLKEDLEAEDKAGLEAEDKAEKLKAEMDEIDAAIAKIDALDDEQKADEEIQSYYQELLNRKEKLQDEINGASASNPDEPGEEVETAESVCEKIKSAFESLKGKYQALKEDAENQDGIPVEMEDEMVNVPGTNFGVVPVLCMEEDGETVSNMYLKVLNPDGTDLVLPPDLDNTGLIQVDGNSMILNCDYKDSDAISECLTKAMESLMTSPSLIGAEGTSSVSEEDEQPEGGEGGVQQEPTTETEGDSFKGNLVKFDKDDLILIANNKDVNIGTTIMTLLSGGLISSVDNYTLQQTADFLDLKGETELSDFIKSKLPAEGAEQTNEGENEGESIDDDNLAEYFEGDDLSHIKNANTGQSGSVTGKDGNTWYYQKESDTKTFIKKVAKLANESLSPDELKVKEDEVDAIAQEKLSADDWNENYPLGGTLKEKIAFLDSRGIWYYYYDTFKEDFNGLVLEDEDDENKPPKDKKDGDGENGEDDDKKKIWEDQDQTVTVEYTARNPGGKEEASIELQDEITKCGCDVKMKYISSDGDFHDFNLTGKLSDVQDLVCGLDNIDATDFQKNYLAESLVDGFGKRLVVNTLVENISNGDIGTVKMIDKPAKLVTYNSSRGNITLEAKSLKSLEAKETEKEWKSRIMEKHKQVVFKKSGGRIIAESTDGKRKFSAYTVVKKK